MDIASQPSGDFENVTPDDDNDLREKSVTKSIYVGTAGNINVIQESGRTGVFPVGAGTHPMRLKRILDTSTTAGDIIAYF